MTLKKLATLALAIITGVNITACTKKDIDEYKSTVTVGVWSSSKAEDMALDKLIESFEKKNNIKVKKKVYTNYDIKLKSELVKKNAPDVFYLDSNMAPELINAGVIEPLNQYITKDFDINDIYPSLLEGFKDSGERIYSIPKDYSSLAVYYNKDLLNEAGFSVDDIPRDLEQWPQFLEKLQANLPDGKKAAIINTDLNRLISLIETVGVSVVDEEGYSNLNHPSIIKAIEFIVDMYKNGHIASKNELEYSLDIENFGSGNVAIIMDGTWILGKLKYNYPDIRFGTVEIPKYNYKNSNILFSVGYSINKNSNNKSNAWKFIEYATGKEGMKIWSEKTGALPSRQSVIKNIDMFNHYILKPHVVGGEYGTIMQRGQTLSIINSYFEEWINKAILGNITVEEAMNKATIMANEEIDIQLKYD